jgi:hypothetical protein
LPQTLKPKAFRVDRCLRCWCQSEAHSEGNLSLPEEKHRSWVREPQTLHSHASLTVPLGRELWCAHFTGSKLSLREKNGWGWGKLRSWRQKLGMPPLQATRPDPEAQGNKVGDREGQIGLCSRQGHPLWRRAFPHLYFPRILGGSLPFLWPGAGVSWMWSSDLNMHWEVKDNGL